MDIAEIAKEIEKRVKKIREHIITTPLIESYFLSNLINGKVFLKLENFQISRSFKIRGITSKIISLDENERKKGIVVASTGNHGIAAATVAKEFKIPCVVFLPKDASELKVSILKRLGAEIKYHGNDCLEAEVYARKYANENDHVFISPYNDIDVIIGQGTIGYEILNLLNSIDAIFVPVGGGGLIGGIGSYVKSKNKDSTEIIGCQPINSAVMFESIKQGRIVDVPSKSTLSDATKGGIEEGSITFELCKKVVDRFVLVSEEEIEQAIRTALYKENIVIEGAGALPIAALIKEKDNYRGKTIILVISGARIDETKLKDIICETVII